MTSANTNHGFRVIDVPNGFNLQILKPHWQKWRTLLFVHVDEPVHFMDKRNADWAADNFSFVAYKNGCTIPEWIEEIKIDEQQDRATPAP